MQLSSLASENKILVVKLKQTNKYPQEVSVALTTDQHVGTSDFINLCSYFLHMVDVQESPEQVNIKLAYIKKAFPKKIFWITVGYFKKLQ